MTRILALQKLKVVYQNRYNVSVKSSAVPGSGPKGGTCYCPANN